MGEAIDKLRLMLAVYVPPHVRRVGGKFVHVDSYYREGNPAVEPSPAAHIPASPAPAEYPHSLYSPEDLTTNEAVKVAIDTLRQVMATSLGSTVGPLHDWLEDPSTREAVQEGAVLFDAVRSSSHKYPGLTKAGKIMAGREWGRYDTLLRTIDLMATFKENKVGLTQEEASNEFWTLMQDRLVPKVMGADYPISLGYIRAALKDRASAWGVDVATPPAEPEPKKQKPKPEPSFEQLAPGVLSLDKINLDAAIGPGDEVWTTPTEEGTPNHPTEAWAVVVRHPDGTGTTYWSTSLGGGGASHEEATPEKTLDGLGAGGEIHYLLYGKVEPESPPVPQPEYVPSHAPKIVKGGVEVPLNPGDVVYIPNPQSEPIPESLDKVSVFIRRADGSWDLYHGPGPATGSAHVIGTQAAAWDKTVNDPSNPYKYTVVAYGPEPIQQITPQEVILPGGETYVLQPGESAYHNKGVPGILIVHPDGSMDWYASGNSPEYTYPAGGANSWATGAMEHLKKGTGSWEYVAGVDLAHEYIASKPKPAPKPKKPKKPKVSADAVPLGPEEAGMLKAHNGYAPASEFFKLYRKQLFEKWVAAVAVYKEAHPGEPSLLDDESRMALMAENVEFFQKVVGRLETLRTLPTLPAQDKASLTKERNRWAALLDFAQFVHDMPTLSDDEMLQRRDALADRFGDLVFGKFFTKGSKEYGVPSWPKGQMRLWRALGAVIDRRLYEHRKAELPFDLDTADDAIVLSWINDQPGGDLAAWMTSDQRKDWVRVWLRDPDVLAKFGIEAKVAEPYALALAKLTQQAKTLKQVDAVAKLAHLDLEAPAPPETPNTAAAVFAAVIREAKRFEAMKELRQRYYRSGTGAKVNDEERIVQDPGTGVWHRYVGVGGPPPDAQVLTEEQVLDAILEESFEPDTDVMATTQYAMDKADATALLGMPSGPATRKAQCAWIKDHGGEFVGKMTQPEREEWIRAHLAANNLLKYAIEERMGHKTNVGKPLTHPKMMTHPGSPHSPLGQVAWQAFSDTAAIAMWGQPYRSELPVDEWPDEAVTTFYVAMRLAEGKGDDELGSPGLLLMRDRVSAFVYWMPGSKLPLPDPSLSSSAPVEPPKTLTGKPEGVSDEVWTLFQALKVVDPATNPLGGFSPGVAALTEAEADFKLKASGHYTALDMQGVYSAPLPIKQMLAGVLNYGTEWEATVPSGIQQLIDDRIKAGEFDPPKPEGYYGAVTNGGTTYYLRPGDQLFEGSVGSFRGINFEPGDAVYFPPGQSRATATMLVVYLDPANKPEFVDAQGEVTEASTEAIDAAIGQGWEQDPTFGAVAPPWVQHLDGTVEIIGEGGMLPLSPSEANHLAMASHPYVPQGPMSVAPISLTIEDARAQGYDPPTDAWANIEAAEAKPVDWSPPGMVASDVDIRAALSNAEATFGIKVSPKVPENAPPQVQRALYEHVLALKSAGMTSSPYLDVANWKAEHGHWGYRSFTPPFPQTTDYAAYIFAGMTDEEAIQQWPTQARSSFVTDYGVTGGSYDFAQIAAVLHKLLVGEHEPVPTSSLDPIVLSYDPDAKSLGGIHKKTTILDQHGNRYLVKPNTNDPGGNPRYRCDVETWANRISNLLGFHAPPVLTPHEELLPLKTRAALGSDGYSYVQLMVDRKGDLTGVDPVTLDDRLLGEVAEEHILDWVLSNHDTYFENILISPDGNRAIGIDKGQAFKFFPDDKLAVGYLPSGNGHPVYYDEIYRAVINHEIDKERADALVRHLLIRARHVEFARDPEFRTMLERSFEKRTDFPAGYTRESYTEAVIERKHHAASDFETLWKGIYEQAGYTWDLPPLEELQISKVENDRGSAWAGTSPEFFEAVGESKIHGQAAMYAGTDLEDGHLLFWEETGPTGERVMVAEGKLRQAADGRLSSWLTAQNVTQGAGVSQMAAPKPTLPRNNEWWSALLSAAMTVNHHQADGEYNASALTNLANIKAEMTKAREAVKAWKESHPTEPFSTSNSPLSQGIGNFSFTDLEQQDAWLDMVDAYLPIADEIQAAKDGQTKTPKYSQYVYVPTPKLEVEKVWHFKGVTGGDYTLKKFVDGTWVMVNNETGSETPQTEEQATTSIATGDWSEEFQGQSATQLAVTVYRRNASRAEGVFQPETGTLKLTGGAVTSGNPGHEYDVEIGDRIRIEYRPWSGEGVPKAQQGLFRIIVSDWSGGDDDLRLAFEQLASMGVDLTPADEASLELTYWRLWSAIADDRAEPPPSVVQALQAIATWRTANPNASDAEELAFLRNLWQSAYLDGIGVTPDEVEWMPRFGHPRVLSPDLEAGHPYWIRPDAKLLDTSPGHAEFPGQSLTYGGTENDAVSIAQSGAYLPSDERTRMLGQWMPKGSSAGDQPHGSSGFIFTHPTYSSGDNAVFTPEAYRRMHSYSFSGDQWGEVDIRKQYAPFDVRKVPQQHTELCVKNAMTLLDDIVVFRVNHTVRSQIIDWLKAHGITTIRGVPIEERFIAGHFSAAMVNDLWERELAWRKSEASKSTAIAA